MEERRRRIITIVVVILGFIRGNIDESTDASLNWTMVEQLRQVYDLLADAPSEAITKATDNLCTAIYSGTGDYESLSEALGDALP